MLRKLTHRSRAVLIAGAAVAALLGAAPAWAQGKPIAVAPQPLAAALREVASKSGVDVLFTPESVRDLRAPAVTGASTAREAVARMIAGTELEVVDGANGSLIVRRKAVRPQAIDSAASAPSVAPQDAQELSEVFVTANKREERLRDVPSAITALSGADLRRTQAQRLEDYATKVPGLNFISTGQGTTQLILRGITAGASQLSSTVAIYVDDTPYNGSTVFSGAATGVPDLDPSDIDHIEVLKGPQGTLYGADALGGVLKFVTIRPDTNAFSGRAAAGVTSVDGGGEGFNLSAAVNLPLVADKLALRLSAFDRRDAGFIDDPARGVRDINEAKVWGGRAALLWKPTENLTVDLSALAQDLKADNPSSMDVLAPGLKPLYGDRQQKRLFDGPKSYRYRVYNARETLDLDGLSLISSTSYATFSLRRSEDVPAFGAVFGAPVRLSQPARNKKFSQELRLQSDTNGALEWRVGGFFTRERSVQSQRVEILSPATFQVLAVYGDVRIPDRYTEYAGFGDLTYHFTPRFDVTVGGRYSHNTQHSHEAGQLAGTPVDIALSTSDSSAIWLINPRFKIDDNSMVYARAASAYRPGGPTTQPPGFRVPTSFDPDHLTNYEVGFKGAYLDRRLTLDIAAFYIDWRKIQLNETVGGFTYITNGGKARSKGVEASATFTPVAGLNITATGAYTDAELAQDVAGLGGLKGDRLPGTPRWNWALDAGYDWRLADGWDAFVGGSYRHVGDRLSDFTLGAGGPGPRQHLGAYDVVDLRAGVGRGGWTLTAFVKNVGDERGLLAVGPLTLAPQAPPYQAAILQPRTFGLDLATTF